MPRKRGKRRQSEGAAPVCRECFLAWRQVGAVFPCRTAASRLDREMAFPFFVLVGMVLALQGAVGWTVEGRTELGTLPGGAGAWECDVRGPTGSVRVAGVSFDAGKAGFRVVDNPPEGRRSFPGILSEAGAVAGINGGYFHPDFRPLGLVVSGGREIHGFEKARLLSGVLVVRAGRIEMVRAGAFRSGKGVQEALQAGPWLVERGGVVAGLNRERRARRSVVATDGKGHWTIVTTGPLTLAETAKLLTLPGLAGDWTVRDALNLDGGSSTSLWAATEPEAFTIFSFGAVRNYLAIVPRHP